MAPSRLVRMNNEPSTKSRPASQRSGQIACLTAREREVLALIAEGRSNEGICAELVVSTKTVESHVRSIFLKLALPRGAGVHARVLAARAWLQVDPA
jgi:DNA-binding NarL/FixJ family response regulator